MTTHALRKTLLASAMILAGASQASAQKVGLSVIFRATVPYYSTPQASSGQPLGYFKPGTRSCVTDEKLLNGSEYIEYILPYSKGVAWTKIPHYNTQAEAQKVIATLFDRDPINDIGCKAELAALLQHKLPPQQQPEVASIPPPVQRTPQSGASLSCVSPSIERTLKESIRERGIEVFSLYDAGENSLWDEARDSMKNASSDGAAGAMTILRGLGIMQCVAVVDTNSGTWKVGYDWRPSQNGLYIISWMKE